MTPAAKVIVTLTTQIGIEMLTAVFSQRCWRQPVISAAIMVSIKSVSLKAALFVFVESILADIIHRPQELIQKMLGENHASILS